MRRAVSRSGTGAIPPRIADEAKDLIEFSRRQYFSLA
jgi:hypothetical protein